MRREIAPRLRHAAVASVGLCVGATLLMLPLQAATVGDGWSDALRLETLRAVLLETSIGTAWQIQAAAALLLAGACLVPNYARGAALSVAAGLGLAASTFGGHAVMQAGWIRVAHQANDALHLLAGGAWLGALVPLRIVLDRLDGSHSHRDEIVALRRFSVAGHVAVALVIATGVANVLLVVDGWPLDWALPYQALLALKILAVAAMTALAVLNRYRFVPQLAQDRSAAIRRLGAATRAEIWLAVVVVGLVSLFGLLEPVRPASDAGGFGPTRAAWSAQR